MSESYIQNLFAERIGGVDYGKDTAIYKFEKIKRAKNAVLEANPGLAELGPVLPGATLVTLPDITTQSPSKATVQLWD